MSDPHVGHQRLIDEGYRPYASLDEMHEDIVRRVNASVGPGDILYVLGDTFIHGYDRYGHVFRDMNGYKVCVRGNHCPSTAKLLKAGFHRVCEQDFVYHYDFFMGPLMLWLAHVPIDNSADKLRDGVIIQRPEPAIERYDIALCGHVHDRFRISPHGEVNVGLDAWGMNPVSAETIARTWHVAATGSPEEQREARAILPMPACKKAQPEPGL